MLKKRELGVLVFLFTVLFVSASSSSIFVWPDPVLAGADLYVSILPGSEGVYKYVPIYDSNDRYEGYISLGCEGYRCYDPVNATYNIPLNWANGTYKIKVYDYLARKFVEDEFEVVGSSYVSRETSFFVWPDPVLAGADLYVSILPGSEGVSKYVYIYDSNDRYEDYISLECEGYRCYDPVNATYNIPLNWANGTYKIKVYDYNIYGSLEKEIYVN